MLLLNIFLKEMKLVCSRDTCSPVFIAALFTVAKMWNQPECPLKDEWTEKMWYIHAME
jgi:hypothetical protein